MVFITISLHNLFYFPFTLSITLAREDGMNHTFNLKASEPYIALPVWRWLWQILLLFITLLRSIKGISWIVPFLILFHIVYEKLFPHNIYNQLPQPTVQYSVLPISPMAFNLKMVIEQSAYNSIKSSTRYWKHYSLGSKTLKPVGLRVVGRLRWKL